MLPQEIFDGIAGFCDQQTLVNLAPTSKKAAAAAQPLLFHTIEYSIDSHRKGLFQWPVSTLIRNPNYLINILDIPHSRLRSYVRIARLICLPRKLPYWPYQPHQDCMPDLFKRFDNSIADLLKIFRSLPCLRELHVQPNLLETTSSIELMRGAPITHLSTSLGPKGHGQIVVADTYSRLRRLFHIKELRSVHLSNISVNNLIPRDQVRFASVTRLTLTHSGPPDAAFADMLAWMRNLKCLEFYSSISPSIPDAAYRLTVDEFILMLQPQKLNLERLLLTFDEGDERILPMTAGAGFAGFEQLKYLSLPCYMLMPLQKLQDSRPSDGERKEKLPLSEVIPKGLCHLNLEMRPQMFDPGIALDVYPDEDIDEGVSQDPNRQPEEVSAEHSEEDTHEFRNDPMVPHTPTHGVEKVALPAQGLNQDSDSGPKKNSEPLESETSKEIIEWLAGIISAKDMGGSEIQHISLNVKFTDAALLKKQRFFTSGGWKRLKRDLEAGGSTFSVNFDSPEILQVCPA